MSKNQLDAAPAHGVQTYEAHTASKGKRSTIAWSLVLSAAAWALHLFISYSFVEWHCRNTEVMSHATAKVILHGLTGALFLVALACTVQCVRASRRAKHTDEQVRNRRRLFMLRFSAMFSALLAVTIVVQGLPNVLVALC